MDMVHEEYAEKHAITSSACIPKLMHNYEKAHEHGIPITPMQDAGLRWTEMP